MRKQYRLLFYWLFIVWFWSGQVYAASPTCTTGSKISSGDLAISGNFTIQDDLGKYINLGTNKVTTPYVFYAPNTHIAISRKFTVSNIGVYDASVNPLSVSLSNFTTPTYFSASPNPLTVQFTKQGELIITWLPLVVGGITGNVEFCVDDPLFGGRFVIPVEGVVEVPDSTPATPIMNVFNGTTQFTDGQTTPFDFGTTVVGTPIQKVFKITNTGPGILHVGALNLPQGFSQVGTSPSSTNPLTILPGLSENFTVRFDALNAGTVTTQLFLSNDDPVRDPFNFAIRATANIYPEIVVLIDGVDTANNSPTAINFGTVALNKVVQKNIVIRNAGSVHMTLSNLTLPSGFTASTPLPTTVYAGTDSYFTIQMDTTTGGSFGGAVSFVNNDPDENPFSFTIAGTVDPSLPTDPVIPPPTGVSPEINVLLGATSLVSGMTSPVDLGTAMVGDSFTKSFIVQNLGSVEMHLSNLTLPAGFSLQGTFPTTIYAGLSNTFSINVDTAAVGTLTGTISFENNDTDENPFSFPVTATVSAVPVPVDVPEIAVSYNNNDIVNGTMTATNLGSATVGTSLIKSFTIQNTGTLAINLSNLSLPTGFTLEGSFPSVVGAGLSATFSIKVDTTSVATLIGTLSFNNDDADENPFNFPITATVTAVPTTGGGGTGTPSIPVVYPTIALFEGETALPSAQTTIVDFGAIEIGTTVTKTFTLKNTGSIPVNLGNLILPNAFSLVGTFPNQILAGFSSTINIQLNSTTAGGFTGSFSFTTNDPNNSTYRITLTAQVDAPFISVTSGDVTIQNGATTALLFGTNTKKTFVVRNITDAPVSVSDLVLPTGFSLSGRFLATTTSLAAGSADIFIIQKDSETASGVMRFKFNRSGGINKTFSFPIAVTNTGGETPSTSPAKIQLFDGSVEITDGSSNATDFGIASVGTPVRKTFTIVSAGNAQLNLGTLSLPTGFSLIGNFPAVVYAGLSSSFTVQLDALTTGTYQGTLSFSTNDTSKTTFNFPITGTAEFCRAFATILLNSTCFTLPVIQSIGIVEKTASNTVDSVKFAGGISVNSGAFTQTTTMNGFVGNPVVVAGSVQVNPSHIGQQADIITVGIYRPLPNLADAWYMMDASNPVLWDADFATLTARQTGLTLQATQSVVLYQGEFLAPGQLFIFFGYRLSDGQIIYTADSINVTIQ
ncbi:choice-of-anchor D domain-containing protein [Beggiatoa leptomitoformis]|uniref:Choice-of-anchor D domain-containing protein n=1 Tax=Beggiatoa leptomitoformis TaxID=288004 RepID=A0A2N9YA05_9GAMM|nr:choice-of-anchor D domain-containing protein [Beggiatoa leptomitoformis]ALG67287.1 choice-of-anchor D domain-containing protein [Beggiatoa leptomitoformis]AUI67284.1 choice-of-anchor D domain-containing protein [Beggiatoa leptomitoformis]